MSVFIGLRKQSNEPLILLIVYHLVAYYFLRIISLNFFDFTFALDRFGIPDTKQIFYACTVIISSIIAIIFGHHLARVENKSSYTRTITPAKPVYVFISLIVFSVSILINSHYFMTLIEGSNPIVNYLLIFTSTAPFIIPLSVYFFATKFTQKLLGIIFLILATTYFLQAILEKGVRGELVYFAELVFFIILTSKLKAIRLKTLLKLISVFPFLLAITYFVYVSATEQRASINNNNNKDNVYSHFYQNIGLEDYNLQRIKRIAARVGSFDYSAELIINADYYESIFNLNYYGKAITDNILTPGFDLFDVPRVAQSTVFIYTDLNDNVKSRQYIANQIFPHSDELTAIGEFYSVFGWLAIVVFVILSFLLTKLYYSLSYFTPYYERLTQTIVLFFISKGFHSFGFDWLLLDIVIYLPQIILISWLLFPPRFLANLGIK